jgi:hypothetical protein
MPSRPRPRPAPEDGRPAFEVNPEPRLVAALREAFGHFTPCDRAWIRVEGELKQISWETSPTTHPQFVADFHAMDADAVIEFLHHHGLVAKPKKRRGRPTRTVAGLSVDQYLTALAVGDPAVMQLNPRQLEQRTNKMFSASTYRTSTTFGVWQTLRIEAAGRAAATAADEIDAGRLSITAKGRKTVARGDGMTPEERRLSRLADAFLAEHDVGEESRT